MNAPEPARPDPAQLCAFWVGREEYVIDIMRVEEILDVPVITPVRRAPKFVEGVINLRGAVIPVVDVRRQLLGDTPAPHAKERLVLCKLGRTRVALRVDGVHSIVKAPLDSLRPAALSAKKGTRPHVLGVCTLGTRMLLMLDVKALLVEREPEA